MIRKALPPARIAGLWLAVMIAGALPAGPIRAQAGPSLGLPQQGEMILNRDVEVRSTPIQDGQVVARLAKGRTVVAFGTPRNTGWTQIGIGGRDLGYVAYDVLDPITVVRDVASTAAVVSARRWAPDGRLRVSHILTQDSHGTARTGKNRRAVPLPRGTALSFIEIKGGQARMQSETDASVLVDPKALIPIVGTHPYQFGDAHALSFYLAKVGDYLTPVEAASAWTSLGRSFPEYTAFSPFVYPVFQVPGQDGKGPGVGLSYTLAFGPFDRTQVNNECVTLAQKLLDCWVVEVKSY